MERWETYAADGKKRNRSGKMKANFEAYICHSKILKKNWALKKFVTEINFGIETLTLDKYFMRNESHLEKYSRGFLYLLYVLLLF